jgi:hypothetical protein
MAEAMVADRLLLQGYAKHLLTSDHARRVQRYHRYPKTQQ